jgi:hypothetical protein
MYHSLVQLTSQQMGVPGDGEVQQINVSSAEARLVWQKEDIRDVDWSKKARGRRGRGDISSACFWQGRRD